jgi:DNA-binding transcriptional LysR family regulator
MAALARRVAPGLSIAADREMFLQYARKLEDEADKLDAQADAEQDSSPSS